MTNGADLCGPARIGAEAGALPSTGDGSRPSGNVYEPSRQLRTLTRAGNLRGLYSLERGGLKVLLATRPRALLRSTLTPPRSKQSAPLRTVFAMSTL